MAKLIPCVDNPKYTLCDPCQDELSFQIRELLHGMGELRKTIKDAPHARTCAIFLCLDTVCDCFKSKIDEINNK